MRGWVLAGLSLLGAVPCAAQTGAAGTLTVALRPTEVTVGDRVEAQVALVWTGPRPAAAPRFPAWQETWGPAEVLAAGEVEAFTDASGRHVYRQNVTLTAFRTGRVELPGVTVAVPLDAETVEIAQDEGAGFEVLSVLPEEGAGELAPRDAAPLVAFDAGRRFPATAAALGGLCLLAAWLLARRLARSPSPAARPRLAPLEELLERLRRLDPAAGEPAHTGLSLGLRAFLGRRLDLRAVEGTTSEIQRRLRRTEVTPGVAQGTVRLLRACDQVKFARAPVDAARTGDRLREAGALAREIENGLRPSADPVETAL